jgi:hypothetical protein
MLCRLHQSDASADSYCVQTRDDNGLFEQFLSLSRGATLTVDWSSLAFYLSLCDELENSDLIGQLRRHSHNPTIDSIYGHYSCHKRVGDVAGDIEFLAAHFYELPDVILTSFDYADFLAILSHDAVRIRDEDSLFDVLCRLIERDISFVGLLEFVLFEFLTVDAILRFAAEFLTIVPFLNAAIWSRIFARLVYPVAAVPSADFCRYCRLPLQYELHDAAPLDGIIAGLTRKCSGNVHDKGIVQVSGSSANTTPGYEAKNAVDLAENSSFISANLPNSWLCYGFKEMKVVPTHYAIRSRWDWGRGKSHPLSWVFEGSLDGQEWTELDCQKDNHSLDAQNVARAFPVKRHMQAKMVRLRLTGPTSNGSGFLCLSSMEIFGQLIEG